MCYILMHKNIEVLKMQMNDDGKITKILEQKNTNHLPIGIKIKNGFVEKDKLNEWWENRSIPASRNGIKTILQEMKISTPAALLKKCYGLSLSDQYWIKPEGVNLEWKNINFFENDFSEDMGELLVGHKKYDKDMNLISPDNTSEGNLKKCWKIINGDRCLLKGGSGSTQQEVFNEVIASEIMAKLNIPHVEYTIRWMNNKPYSCCKDFVNTDCDFVSAFRLMSSEKQDNNDNRFTHLIKMTNLYDIPNVRPSLDQMLVIDYLIGNEDRHLNNFGFLRDVNNLKFIGFAPIFDSGSSLGFEVPNKLLETHNPDWKPFKQGKIQTQLELVSSFDWINFDELRNIENIIEKVVQESKGWIDDERKNGLIKFVNKKIFFLENYVANKKKAFTNLDEKNSEYSKNEDLIFKVLDVAQNKKDSSELLGLKFDFEHNTYIIKNANKTQGQHRVDAIIQNCDTQKMFLEKNFAGTFPFKLNLNKPVTSTSFELKKDKIME